jgi:hypothetical protein
MEEQQALEAAGAGLGVGVMLTYFAILAIWIVSQWRILEKGGKPGWACLIPIYGTLVHLDMIRRPWWWILLMLVPFVNFYIFFIYLNDLSKGFGKSVGFTVGLIFLPFIFFPILAFGDADFDENLLDN